MVLEMVLVLAVEMGMVSSPRSSLTILENALNFSRASDRRSRGTCVRRRERPSEEHDGDGDNIGDSNSDGVGQL